MTGPGFQALFDNAMLYRMTLSHSGTHSFIHSFIRKAVTEQLPCASLCGTHPKDKDKHDISGLAAKLPRGMRHEAEEHRR